MRNSLVGVISTFIGTTLAATLFAQSVAFTDVFFTGDYRDIGLSVKVTPLSRDNLEYCWEWADGNGSACPVYNYKAEGNRVTFSQKNFGVWVLETNTGLLTFTNDGGDSFSADLTAKLK